MPLTSLGLLHMANAIDRRDPLLAWRRSLAAHLAVPVASGFLLLLPLLAPAAVMQQGSQRKALRTAVRSAARSQELNQRLAQLQGP